MPEEFPLSESEFVAFVEALNLKEAIEWLAESDSWRFGFGLTSLLSRVCELLQRNKGPSRGLSGKDLNRLIIIDNKLVAWGETKVFESIYEKCGEE
jgi:hypothetical protein